MLRRAFCFVHLEKAQTHGSTIKNCRSVRQVGREVDGFKRCRQKSLLLATVIKNGN
jgi:hypothetical protein